MTEYRRGPNLLVRAVWWASAIWMAIAWLVQVTVIGIPLALLMFDRTPFVATLYRY